MKGLHPEGMTHIRRWQARSAHPPVTRGGNIKRPGWGAALMRAGVVFFVLSTSCAQKEQVTTNKPQPPLGEIRFVELGTPGTLAPGDGAAVVSMYCVVCHSPDLIRQQRLTTKQWTATVEKMEKWSTPLPDHDRATAIAYLSKHYGPDNHFVPLETTPVN